GFWQIQPAAETLATNINNHSLQFDNHIEVADVAVVHDEAMVGQSVTVRLKWRITAAVTTPEAITVRIMRRDGRLATNSDIAFDPSSAINTWHSTQVILAIPLDLTPGNYDVSIGAYRMQNGSFISLSPAEPNNAVPPVAITVLAAKQPQITMHPLSIDVADEAVLMGVDYDTGLPGQWRLLTHWKLPTHPISVTVFNTAGTVASPPLSLPEAPDEDSYFTLIFDVAPAIGLRLGVGDGIAQISLPDGHAGERYIAFADQIVLTGVSTERGADQLKVDLTWLANHSLQSDYVISTRVTGEGFYAAHDGIPALGTLPTLKWIRGSQIFDRHPFDLNHFSGKLSGTIVVYDSTSRLLLPALDERYEHGVSFDVN
ncbi:MAG TPA: hypothetical protein VGK87_09885, partial [Anaerolineae bacterium]